MSYKAASEQTLLIDVPHTNHLKIKGILRGSLDRPTVLLVHGRPGNGNDTRMYLFARYLLENNISSLRLFLYDDQEGTRDLLNTTDVDTHATDLDAVVRYVRKEGAVPVLAVGHSYGGLTILKSKSKLDGAVLWDASHGLVWQELSKKPPKPYRQYNEDIVLDKRGKGYVVSRAVSDADHKLGDTSPLARDINCPLFVVAAGTGKLAEFGKMYYDAAGEPKKYLNIPGASHLFLDSDEVVLELFEQTTSWIKETINSDK